MKALEVIEIGATAILAGVLLAFTPLVNLLIGWWAAPLLVLGGTFAILATILFEVWEAVRISIRFLVCHVYQEEEEGRPSFHHHALNTALWQLLGGGHCPVRSHH